MVVAMFFFLLAILLLLKPVPVIFSKYLPAPSPHKIKWMYIAHLYCVALQAGFYGEAVENLNFFVHLYILEAATVSYWWNRLQRLD